MIKSCSRALTIYIALILIISLFLPSTVSAQAYTNYKVVSGDVLWKIAVKFNTSISDIMSFNNLNNSTIYVGQVLKIPNPTSKTGIRYLDYKVKSGDTLNGLAEYFGTTIANIKSINALTSNFLSVGQVLKMPAVYIEYRVISGDTLYKIATRNGTTVSKIMMFSGLTNYNINVGQVLKIPHLPPSVKVSTITHIVDSGDTIWNLSTKYGIPQDELLRVNGLKTTSSLSVGQKLTIPVYSIPVHPTPGSKYGEYLDWWTEAQYLFPIGKKAKVIDFMTGKTFGIERSIGASHADCEPLNASDAAIMKELWGGSYSWNTRAVIVVVDGRRIAASVASMPHGIEYIGDNSFSGHFDVHFKDSRRHKDNEVDPSHQAKIRESAGIS